MVSLKVLHNFLTGSAKREMKLNGRLQDCATQARCGRDARAPSYKSPSTIKLNPLPGNRNC